MDEVLAVGDAAFQDKCQKRMQEMLAGGTTLLFVSHSIKDVKILCDHAIWLNKGHVMMKGNASEVCGEYMKSLGVEERTER